MKRVFPESCLGEKNQSQMKLRTEEADLHSTDQWARAKMTDEK